MDSSRLMSLLYLADRQMLLDYGTTVTGDRYLRSPHGPVLVRLLGMLTLKSESAGLSEDLSRHEVKLLERTDERFGWLDEPGFLSALRNAAPEWARGMAGMTISPEAILRAASRTEEEVRQIAETAEDCWFFDSAVHGPGGTDA